MWETWGYNGQSCRCSNTKVLLLEQQLCSSTDVQVYHLSFHPFISNKKREGSKKKPRLQKNDPSQQRDKAMHPPQVQRLHRCVSVCAFMSFSCLGLDDVICVRQEVDRVSVQLSLSSLQDPGGGRSPRRQRLSGQGSARVAVFNVILTFLARCTARGKKNEHDQLRLLPKSHTHPPAWMFPPAPLSLTHVVGKWR